MYVCKWQGSDKGSGCDVRFTGRVMIARSAVVNSGDLRTHGADKTTEVATAPACIVRCMLRGRWSRGNISGIWVPSRE